MKNQIPNNMFGLEKVAGLKIDRKGKFNSPMPLQDLIKILKSNSFKINYEGHWEKEVNTSEGRAAVLIKVWDQEKKYDYTIEYYHEGELNNIR
jgi:hypothetical protein